MRRTWVVLRREWTELKQNRFLVVSTLMLPLILSGMVIFAALSVAGSDVHPSEVESLLAQAPRGYSPRQVVMFMLMKQLLATFLAVPAIIPALITSYSIIGEKQLRTLEPVLATPVRVGELLAGKCLAAFVPALLATWLSFGITCAILQSRLPPETARVAPPTTDWLIAIFFVAPLLAFGSNTLTVIVSSRVRDPRAAHQFASLLILPIIGVVLVQLARGILLGWRFWLATALALAWLDAILLRLASAWFNHEGILAKFG